MKILDLKIYLNQNLKLIFQTPECNPLNANNRTISSGSLNSDPTFYIKGLQLTSSRYEEDLNDSKC